MYRPDHRSHGEAPAPQLTQGELLTVCKLLKEAGMGEEETYVKFKILADHAGKRAMQGRAYIALQAD